MEKNQRVYFYDERHGFWRLGTVYKVTKKLVSVRDLNGHRYRVANSSDSIKLFEEYIENK